MQGRGVGRRKYASRDPRELPRHREDRVEDRVDSRGVTGTTRVISSFFELGLPLQF